MRREERPAGRTPPPWGHGRSTLVSLYVHIPFCEHKCQYCDFYSVTDRAAMAPFVHALACEIRLAGGGGEPAETVFFGGGTPSLLKPAQLETILTGLRTGFCLAADAEISLEANPGTVTLEKLSAFRSLGINRLSIGVQSFQDADLTVLGRIHDGVQALECLAFARAAGFGNVGLDLIYGIPGQGLSGWDENLRRAVDLGPEHLSAYCLMVEEHTPLHRMVEAGRVRVAPTDLEAALYERAMERLEEAGYEHYEVSNYARPGFRCRHNGAYWSHQAYLGFGPSAHSFRPADDGKYARRWWNVAALGEYGARLARGIVPVESEEQLGPAQLLRERIFLGLRSGGLSLDELASGFGDGWLAERRAILRALADEGLAILEGPRLRLTRRGYVVCDEIGARLCGA
jgi:oxygen-independent coproporphyrinogen III oxidase